MLKQCFGDNYNIHCPHCNKCNHYPVDTLIEGQDRVCYDFQKPCWHCRKIIHYRGTKGRDKQGFPIINLIATAMD